MSERLRGYIPEFTTDFARQAAAAALAGGLALGLVGCSESPHHKEVPAEPSAAATYHPSPGAHHETSPPTPRQLLANPDLLKDAYPELPAAVRKSASGVVYVEEDATLQTDTVYPGGQIVPGPSTFAYRRDYPGVLDDADGTGSVVRVSRGNDMSPAKVILTDAHVAIADSDYCAETTVKQLGTDGNPIVHAARKQALHYYGTPAATKVQSPDKAVIIDNDDRRPSVPLVTNAHINPGEVAFSINYMPLKNGALRDPIDQENTKYPAEYSMMALGTDPDTGMEVFLERGRSYGALKDTVSRHGASGGPIILADGTEYGLTTGVYENLNTQTEAFDIGQIAANAKDPEVGDMLRNITPQEGDGLVLVQPVTQKEVNVLYQEAEQAEPCVARPHKRVRVSK